MRIYKRPIAEKVLDVVIWILVSWLALVALLIISGLTLALVISILK